MTTPEQGCADCHGFLAVPDIFGDYVGCPSCVLDGDGGLFVTLPGFRLPAAEDEPLQVYCCRCPWDEALWLTTDRHLLDSVDQHVHAKHREAPGPSRPDGTPIWVEDADWWVVTEQDVAQLAAAAGHNDHR